MSEELETSLQQAIETYLNDRLRAIDEQVSRLQGEVTEALGRLRESANAESLNGTTLSAAIFAHLQTARGQQLSGATVSAPVQPDTGVIKRAVSEIEAQQTQTDILKSLLTGAIQFAERVALFVIKNDQAIGWRVCEASDPTSLELIGGVSLPLSSQTILTSAVHARKPASGDPRSSSRDQMLTDQLGGSPQFVNALPLIARGKVVAVLYADSSSSDSSRINSDALEILVRVAAMAVNMVSVHRVATEARPEPVRARPVESVPAALVESMPPPAPEVEATYEPEIESRPAEPVVEPVAEPAAAAPEPVSARFEYSPEELSVPVTPEVVAQPSEQFAAVEPEPAPEPSIPAFTEPAAPAAPAPFATSSPELPKPEPSVAPVASGHQAPLGRSRRFGVTEPDLPLEVSEEERRLHNDARRFARLLVSEIKLYNEPKVKEGRSHGDLYDRLREDIDRSRQMYDKRVKPTVAERHDYFHQELVNMLAEGDPAKLGRSYPGAVSVG